MSEERGLAWRLASHLKKYMLAYTVLSIVLAVVVGHFASYALARISKGTYTDLVMVLAIATVYPSMIQLRGEALGSAFKQWKGLLLSLAYVFLLAPFMGFALRRRTRVRIGIPVDGVELGLHGFTQLPHEFIGSLPLRPGQGAPTQKRR